MPESRKRAVLASASLDFPSIAAGETAELTIALDDARAGDALALGPPANLPAGLVATGYVNASDAVVVRLLNSTAGAIDPSAGGVKEVQDIVHDHTGGTFQISFASDAAVTTPSAALAFDDDGTGISGYLEALEINGTAVAVTVVENATGDWTVTFDTPVDEVAAIAIEDDSLTGGTTIDVTETVKGVSSEDALWSVALII